MSKYNHFEQLETPEERKPGELVKNKKKVKVKKTGKTSVSGRKVVFLDSFMLVMSVIGMIAVMSFICYKAVMIFIS